jgi:hypothetical protein
MPEKRRSDPLRGRDRRRSQLSLLCRTAESTRVRHSGSRSHAGMSSRRPNMLGLRVGMAVLAGHGGLRTPPA